MGIRLKGIISIFLSLLILFSAGLGLELWKSRRNNSVFSSLTEEEKTWFQENKKQVTLLFGYQAPPNAFHDKEGKYSGLLVDYAGALANKLNWNPETKMFSTWDELINYCKTGRHFFVVGIAPTPGRSEYLAFTSTFIEIPYIIVMRKNSPPVKSLEGLKNIRTGVVKNYAAGEYIRRNYEQIPLVETSDNLEGLRKVATGDIDAMVLNQAYASYLIESQGLSNLVITGNSEYRNKLAVAVSSDELILRNILNKALQSITLTERKEMTRRWISGMSLQKNRFDWLIIIVPFLGILTLISGLALGWIISLKKTVSQQTFKIREDMEQLESALDEKKILLRELYHRTKNNLQLVNSLLTLHMSSDNTPEVNSVFNEMQNRIHSLSLVHEMLCNTGDLKEIRLDEYLKELISYIEESVSSGRKNITLDYDMQEIYCTLEQAAPLGLISNELILNCFKHAFTNGSGGTIRVVLKKLSEKRTGLIISDNGQSSGKPRSQSHTGIGLITVETLASQLSGELSIKRDRGMTVSVEFET